jgi:hypothetical protein
MELSDGVSRFNEVREECLFVGWIVCSCFASSSVCVVVLVLVLGFTAVIRLRNRVGIVSGCFNLFLTLPLGL